MRIRCLIALLCAGVLSMSARAGLLYEYTFSGTLFDVDWLGEPFEPFDQVEVGSPWEAVFVVNPEDVNPGLNGFYVMTEATIELPGIGLSTTEGHVRVDVIADEIAFVASDMPYGGNTVTRFAGGVTDDDLPDVAMLEGMPFAEFGFGAGELGGPAIDIAGTIDHVSLTIIPTPASVMAFAGAPLLSIRRRSRRTGPIRGTFFKG